MPQKTEKKKATACLFIKCKDNIKETNNSKAFTLFLVLTNYLTKQNKAA